MIQLGEFQAISAMEDEDEDSVCLWVRDSLVVVVCETKEPARELHGYLCSIRLNNSLLDRESDLSQPDQVFGTDQGTHENQNGRRRPSRAVWFVCRISFAIT